MARWIESSIEVKYAAFELWVSLTNQIRYAYVYVSAQSIDTLCLEVEDPDVEYNEVYHEHKSLPHHDYHLSDLCVLVGGIVAIKDHYLK